MRCLHCGKELAVFKRLARQEFCSDDHRRQYREKYDQLALGRLLEEKPPEYGAQSGPKRNKGPISLGLTDARVPGQTAPAQPPPAPTAHARENGAAAPVGRILEAPVVSARDPARGRGGGEIGP